MIRQRTEAMPGAMPMDYNWLREAVQQQYQSSEIPIGELTSAVYQILASTKEDEIIQVELLEILGDEHIEFVNTLLMRRSEESPNEQLHKKQRRKELRLQGSMGAHGIQSSRRPQSAYSSASMSSQSFQPPNRSFTYTYDNSTVASKTIMHPAYSTQNSSVSRKQNTTNGYGGRSHTSNNLFSGSRLEKFEYIQQGNSPQKFIDTLEEIRKKTASSVMEFEYPMGRTRILSSTGYRCIKSGSKGVVYWMSRDQRVQDNWALLYAQKLALENSVPLHIAFCLVPKFLDASHRMFDFMLRGLAEVEQECRTLNIHFHLLIGHASAVLPKFVSDHMIGCVVTDFAPLRVPRMWVNDVSKTLPQDVLFVQVDTHNLVPCWQASHQSENAAYMLKNRMAPIANRYISEFPPVVCHPVTDPISSQNPPVDWAAADASLEVDRSVPPVAWAKPGTRAGLKVLETFVRERLKRYRSDRNNPNVKGNSDLSPWFHFGHVSVQRALLVANQFADNYTESVDKFFHEALIWRELAENYCYYNANYDSWKGCPDWSRRSWNEHREDKRQFVYSRQEMEQAKTHDDVWNAAQIQMVQEGKMHGYLRMYWAKKMMEWTETPERALQDAIYLNDKYSLDGRDPGSYGGIMWCICGVHDREMYEKKVTGKLRTMTLSGIQKRFNTTQFVSKYKGRKHIQGPIQMHFTQMRSKVGVGQFKDNCDSVEMEDGCIQPKRSSESHVASGKSFHLLSGVNKNPKGKGIQGPMDKFLKRK